MRLDIFEASETSGLRQSPGCSLVKNPPAMREPQDQSLGQEDALEEEKATHSSILAWRIPWTRGAWWASVQGGHKESNMTEQWSLQGAHM